MGKKAWILGVVLAVVAVAIVWLVVRPPTGQGDARSIRIGAISPFTGEGARYGHAARNGIDLAVDEINAKGGLKGAKILVQYEDDRGNQADAVSAFNKLVSVDRVPAVLGPFYSGNVLACVPIADRSKVVLLTASATSDNVRGAGPYVFRVCPSNDEQARTIAEYAFKTLGFRTAFVIYRNVDYGVTLRDAFDKAFKAAGGKVVGVEAVPADAGDVRAQLTKVKQTSPDFIFAAVHFPEGGVLLRQAKELGIKAAVMGTDGGHDPELIKIAGDAAEGSYWVTMGWGNESSNPAIAAFRGAYHQRFGEDPGVYSGLYYDATMVLTEAIRKAASFDGPSIREALVNSDYEGVTGRNRFDDHGDVTKPFAIYQVHNGKFVPVSR